MRLPGQADTEEMSAGACWRTARNISQQQTSHRVSVVLSRLEIRNTHCSSLSFFFFFLIFPFTSPPNWQKNRGFVL